jgi:hypothetical protein
MITAPELGQTLLPLCDSLPAVQELTVYQPHEDIEATGEKVVVHQPKGELRDELKRTKGDPRKPGATFDFPGPVIDEDGEDDAEPA